MVYVSSYPWAYFLLCLSWPLIQILILFLVKYVWCSIWFELNNHLIIAGKINANAFASWLVACVPLSIVFSREIFNKLCAVDNFQLVLLCCKKKYLEIIAYQVVCQTTTGLCWTFCHLLTKRNHLLGNIISITETLTLPKSSIVSLEQS